MKFLGKLIVNLAMIASIAILAISGLTFFKVITPLVVVSGSMEPEIATGSLIIAKEVDAESVKVGDVASFPRADGVLVTHRVISNDSMDSSDTREIKMKGDANEHEDKDPYYATEALVPVVSIPVAGTVMAFINNNKFMLIAALSFGFGIYLITKMVLAHVREKKTSEVRNNTREDEENDES